MSQISAERSDALPPPLRLAGVDGASLEIHPQGAHLSRWTPAGETDNRLFLSARSEFRAGAAIRGGVPVIFPQFAAEGSLPKHGFARTALWQLREARGAAAVFMLTDSTVTRALWPQAFEATLEIAASGCELRMTLSVFNRGPADAAFTAALHTYLQVGDIGETSLTGLQGLRYRDSANAGAAGVETATALTFGGEIDRIHFDAPGELILQEPQRALTIRQQGFRDTVIWNPGAEKAAALADMEPGGERRMVCVEAAAIGEPVRLASGARWSGTQWLAAR